MGTPHLRIQVHVTQLSLCLELSRVPVHCEGHKLAGMLKEHRVPVLVVQQTAQGHAVGAGRGGCGVAWQAKRAVRACQTKLPQLREAAASDPGTPRPSGLLSATSLHYWGACRLASLGSTVFAENSGMGTGQWLSEGRLCPLRYTGPDVGVSCATGLWGRGQGC